MSAFNRSFVKTELQENRYEQLSRAADRIAGYAEEADRLSRFSHASIEVLREIGYPAFTLPCEYEGKGISLYEFVLYQERLAQGDASIALGMGWHLGILFDLAHKRPWPETKFAEVCLQSARNGALLNRAASESATGSPSRGGMPQTVAVQDGGGYRIRGRKTFTTLAPVLDYFIVTAVLEETGEHAELLVERETAGVSIDPTWNMAGMRGTASHDLVLDDAWVPADSIVEVHTAEKGRQASPYLLHIPACYLGIGLAARREALHFAARYQPSTLDKPILHTEQVKRLLGLIELELCAARHFMYSVAERWDQGVTRPESLAADLAAVKYAAVRAAVSAVDQAMQIVGVHSLAMSHPLQRMYRDVRFGLHNPPMNDTTLRLLADRAAAEAEAEGPGEGARLHLS
ncbi:acyl-CoA dehydrogenase family protein [Paenibacillus sp. y28]|uniref:acyl-CoA dehydrogenase family protein n=1 Tax=Paenibacillus sp. y28 TaxID=3129110 RepID=UPI003015BC09